MLEEVTPTPRRRQGSAAQISPRPLCGSRRPVGLSLLELMIAVAILTILLLVTMPAFSSLLQQQRLKGAAETVLSDLMLARSEAVRRNAPVLVKLGTGTNGCLGFGVGTNTNSCSSCRPEASVANGRCDLKTTDLSPTAGEYPGVELKSASAASFQFTAVRGAPDVLNASITLSVLGAQPAREITVKLSALGLTSLCASAGSVSGIQAC